MLSSYSEGLRLPGQRLIIIGLTLLLDVGMLLCLLTVSRCIGS